MATGGGGYRWATVVPRAWTVYFAEMAGAELPDALPRTWVERTHREAREPVPDHLSEPPVTSPRADAEAVRRSIEATKRAIFPFYRLR